MSNIVRVPKPNQNSYNPNRPLAKNTLLLNQVKHLLKLEKTLPPAERTGTKLKDLKTEAQASDYAAKVTAIFHPQAARAR